MNYSNFLLSNTETESPSRWRIAGKVTNDDLLNAHVSGIEIGMKEHEKIIEGQHQNLRSLAFKISENIYSQVEDIFKINLVGMKMRVQGFSSFGTLFMLKPTDFYAEQKIEEVYRFLHEEQKKITQISWSFVLMPITKDLNESAMTSDGYTLSYAQPT